MEHVCIEGVTLHLAHPDELNLNWVGQEELMAQILAAWLMVGSAAASPVAGEAGGW